VSSAGCILPLTLRTDLPEGLGTRHRAAVGITEETDALVVVVSEETAKISVVLGGEMLRGLDAPRLRVVLRDILGGERKELPEVSEITGRLEIAEGQEAGHATAS
jgi:diadenylate cyclase